jgi:hypothetical protein
MRKRRTKADKAFLCGYAIACAEIVRLHNEPTIAADVLNASNFSLEDFERAELDPYELDEIKKLFAEEASLRRKS